MPREAGADLVSRGLTLKSIDEARRTVNFIASTDAVDSYDEVVEQTWILDRYLSNPVVLFGHNSRELPIGKATRCEVVDVGGRKQLECTVQFLSSKANPRAEEVWQSVLEGGLRAVSVGFKPNETRFEKRNGVEVFVLSQNELHEISVVPIPANPEALAHMKAKALAAAGTEPESGAAAPTEKIMLTEKEMAERVAKAEAEKNLAEKQIADANKALESSKNELNAALGTIKSLETDRDSHKARADKAEETVIASEVDALVGKKIAPAEKETFVELRKSNPSLFTKMVAARPDMKLLGGAVVPDEKSAAPTVNGGAGNGADLSNKIFGA